MLSSRPHNIAFSTNTDTTSSIKNNTFKPTTKSLKHGRSLRSENMAHSQMISVTGRKQNVVLSTPAAGSSLSKKGPRQMQRSGALAEITNCTPFIKQNLPITPGQASSKPTKLFNIFDNSAASVRRISSTRKKLRLPQSASKSFETPETTGNHWDVSDVSIAASITEEINVAEYGDIEYLPPTAIEPVFDPGFEMPDYKEVGATLFTLFRTMSVQHDSEASEETTHVDILKEIGSPTWEMLELPDLSEDDVFIPTKPNHEQATAPQPSSLLLAYTSREATSSSSLRRMSSRENPLKPISTTFHKSSRPLSLHVTSASTTSAGVKAKGTMHSRIPSLSKKFTISANDTTKPQNTQATRIRSTIPVDAARRLMPIASVRVSSAPNLSKSMTRIKPSPNLINGVKPPQKTFTLPDDTVLDLFVDKTDEEIGNDFLFTL